MSETNGNEERRLVFGCCFCGEGVEPPYEPKALVLHWGSEDEDWQQWWCHLECFVGALHENVPGPFAWEDVE